MNVEGELVIRLDTRGGHVTALTSRAARPRVGPTLFVGRRAAEIAPLARSLFSVCGRSQAIAAHAALEAIEAGAPDGAEAAPRARAVALESLQEHAGKIFVVTPRLLGREPDVVPLAEVRRAIAASATDMLAAWARRALFEPAAFLAIADPDALHAWSRAAGTPAAALCAAALSSDPSLGASETPLLPRVSPAWLEALAAEIDARDDFDAAPALQGRARETGALARTASHPLVDTAVRAWGRGVGARLVARLVETAQLLVELEGGNTAPSRFGGARTGQGTGLGWAETARGLVVHRVALAGDRVASYRIVAPTEWNFHPDGAFVEGARGLEGSAAAIDAGVHRLVASLDPCVGVRYEACHA